MLYKYLILAAFVLLVSACSGQKATPQNSAEKYFQQGEKYFDSQLYDDAIASWEKVRDTYYSAALNMLAELKIAEAYYLSERYEEAAAAYDDFLKRHPNDPRISDVLYRLGLSNYQQILSADRDQTSTRNALKVFEELLRRYPDYPQAEEAKRLIQLCRTRLAEHEIYVGHYYLKQGQYQAAIKRLENLLQQYPDYYYRDEAFFYLWQAYKETGELEKSQAAYQKLSQQFPGSEYLQKAQELESEDS